MKKSAIVSVALALLLSALPISTSAESIDPDASLAIGGVCTIEGEHYLTDRYSRAIYMLEGDQPIPIIGQTEEVDLDGRPIAGYIDGRLASVAFGEPWGIVPYRDGLLIADRENHVLRYFDLKKDRVYTVAGSGKADLLDGKGRDAAFASPSSVAIGEDGIIYVADTANHAIRCVKQNGIVTTLIGGIEGDSLGNIGETRLSYPTGICYANGQLYIADSGNHRILALKDGICSLVAGASLTGDAAWEGDYLNGSAKAARFSNPMAVAVHEDGIYVADTGNGTIRVIRDGYVCSLPADSFAEPLIAPDAFFTLGDTLYVSDSFNRACYPIPSHVTELFYTDISDSPHADAIRFVSANSLMGETENGCFSPDQTVSRGQFLSILAQIDGMDIAVGESYEIGVAWATSNAISDGSEPEADITLEQLLTMIYRYEGEPEGSAAIYTAEASDYARPALAWAYTFGIVKADDELLAKDCLTRGEVAEILERFLYMA